MLGMSIHMPPASPEIKVVIGLDPSADDLFPDGLKVVYRHESKRKAN
jgi:hypothetical protein